MNKDQQLMESAYDSIRSAHDKKISRLLDGPPREQQSSSIEDEYKQKYAAVRSGEITPEEWSAYCMDLLSKILSTPEIAAVMKRLKDR